MDLIDASVFVLLAIIDIAILAYLRHWHRKSERTERMMRCLEFGIRRETTPQHKTPSGQLV